LVWASDRIITKAKEKNRGIFLNQKIVKKRFKKRLVVLKKKYF